MLAPSGRVIVVAAARRGLWSNAERTPFGHGRPFTRRQLEELVREAELEPVAWSRALYAPPWRTAGWAEGFEQAGARLWPALAGLILLEAVKQTFAVKPKGVRARLVNPLPGVFAPTPVPAGGMRRMASCRAPKSRFICPPERRPRAQDSTNRLGRGAAKPERLRFQRQASLCSQQRNPAEAGR